ncbi:MFS-type efflux pump MSMEG_3705-like isoform X1 [Amphibalanus amphitrite]|uniref:MFS-type efflux pump MSMEG_3705-like isoform X1 n=2 Tax=Amphibalanus amphitrite TaxID=1232801 RepID=UPI001C919D69|nr:MFS-type efflux pump MSMEG_3705-like isoform X1 [Amphibalanus amphitrite]XP_043214142.1 MFS-type efflux pump MSMEG_3705-like isoform X1 [Amphibalanus amphitrite]XP_043214143.1 MFS-type efflux pump MSMEG_3705-like isoform X1 [Amphibalanus amphitrite]XP_043214144.1 MFS-type efflux pump MSMEG_3705-like isoform X1 [Amphibalanus amphitrite]
MSNQNTKRRRYRAQSSNDERQPLLRDELHDGEQGGAPAAAAPTGLRGLLRSSGYSLYVLLLLLLTYLLNQLDRYMLAIVARPSAQEIEFGDKGCLLNETVKSTLEDGNCTAITTETTCTSFVDADGHHGCKWDYTGTGTEYNLLAGPVFILIYTFAGIPMGLAADLYNRKLLLAGALILWSTCTFLTGFAEEYWELAVLRFGIGFGEAGCTPFATSLLADYFIPELRGTALGVYNWGIYFGYSMAYAIGNFITDANIMDMGWRWSYFISGGPGILLGILMIFTMKEPQRAGVTDESRAAARQKTFVQRLPEMMRLFFRPSLFLLCFAGAIRNAAGYVWSYSTQTFFEGIGQTSTQIGAYMSWIPLVAGSIGVVFGGFISDRVVSRVGPHGRVWVIIISQLLAAPFVFCVLFVEPPWAYISLIPVYIIGEMWIPITLAVLVELVPAEIRTAAVAFYFFVISNVGGNMPLLVDPVKQAFKNAGNSEIDALRDTLYLFYPGEYILGALLYLLALISLRRDLRIAQEESARAGSIQKDGESNEGYEPTAEET